MTSVSEIAIGEPSFTDAGALKVAEGATLLTETVAEYSTLSRPSSSLTWPLTTTLAPVAVQVWLLAAPYAVQSSVPHLKRYWCVSPLPGSTTFEREISMLELVSADAGALKVADGATFVTVTEAL
jgi:hypothetical protein